jgi:hypothetical protein
MCAISEFKGRQIELKTARIRILIQLSTGMTVECHMLNLQFVIELTIESCSFMLKNYCVLFFSFLSSVTKLPGFLKSAHKTFSTCTYVQHLHSHSVRGAYGISQEARLDRFLNCDKCGKLSDYD